MKKLFFLLLLLASPQAQAAPCQIPAFYDGFSGQFFNTSIVAGFVYGIDEVYMYVPLVNGQTIGFINVPQSTAQNFNYASKPDTFYSTQIYGRYRRPLLTESCVNIKVDSKTFLIIG